MYFLYSKKANNIYIGCTHNIKKRLEEHNKGFVKSTKNRRPLFLIYQEKYTTLAAARKREDYLKSLYGVRERKRIVNENLKMAPYTKTF